ncbi:hypothetical protein CAOG_009580 [Capsaspora owczarzaki ATCC 30864]|uniref:Uncharacterized protein n=1 Tax=Capsaspora owczarzaki (strain ATCC 30864) TaxID=595528 RepID=A0A0D2U9D3_CAPO3|nr:hypothetical protein CAOG_009580 [Capsaspora owczarzaki ATCC 30864]
MAAVEQSEQRRQRRRRGPCSLASASDSELMPSMLRLRLRLMGTTALLLMLLLMLLLVLADQARADAPPAHRRLPRIQWAQNEARLFVTLQMEGEMVGDPQIRLNETHFAVEATTLKSKASSPPTSGAGAAAVKSMPELAEADQSDQAVESSRRNTKEQQQVRPRPQAPAQDCTNGPSRTNGTITCWKSSCAKISCRPRASGRELQTEAFV